MDQRYIADRRPVSRFFHSSDMLFTKRSQNGAQIERTKGFDPKQKARHRAGFLLPANLWLKSAAFSQ
ncbi:hypothetical protein DOZ80_09055 [Pseudomonas fluorescens]|uniref:Uncharacterized protein n=1 Tax=Pseudomonas fluorescens TaxID=294 RepID=A0A327N8Z4_PSEFL|nr:hypothetical protein DOZ80_09055 [Pseudomonas fluorescens]